MLELHSVNVAYGSIQVLHDISIRVDTGEFVAIVGPNGAGKSTLFNAISGIADTTSGTIMWDGTNLDRTLPSARAHFGIAHVPEGRQVFPSLSVLENLEMGAFALPTRSRWPDRLAQLYEWFPRLADRSQQAAGTLSGGEQQMLAIARGLASSPRLLMLDEPSMGLAPGIADTIFERVVEIHESERISVLLVEQRVAEALHFAARTYVLETGRVILEGNQETLKNDDRIRAAYLGM